MWAQDSPGHFGHSGVCPPPGGLAEALAQPSGCLPWWGCCACRAPPSPAAGVGALRHGMDVALGPCGSGAEGHLHCLFQNLCPGGSLPVPSAPAWGPAPLVVPCVMDPEPLEQGCVLSPSRVRREPSRRQLAGLAELRPPTPEIIWALRSLPPVSWGTRILRCAPGGLPTPTTWRPQSSEDRARG